MNGFKDIDAAFPHWNYGHPKILYGLIRALKPVNVVEVGTMYGYAACCMAQAVKDNGIGMVMCIDDFSEVTPHLCGPSAWQLKVNELGLQDFAKLIVGDSRRSENWPSVVDFAYIDGWHSFEACHDDFFNAAKRGAACICIDDVLYMDGPKRFIKTITDDWNVVVIPSDQGLAICTPKTEYPTKYFQE